MFDHYNIHDTEYIPYTKTVIEKRAPTDESIRLYGEMKEKAYASVLDTLELHDNILNMTAILYEDFDHDLYHMCKYKFMLNGKEIKGEIRVSRLDMMGKRLEEIYKKIVADAAQYIAVEIVMCLEEERLK